MASREKVKQFIEESESHKHYSSIVEYSLTYFIAKARQEGNTRFADDLENAKNDYHEHFQWALDLTTEVYAELFTDEEVDNLIILHSNPALKKARALTADIMNKILNKYLAASG